MGKNEGRSQSELIDGLLTELEHPLCSEIQALRKLILAADPLVQEGIKWNSLSFRTTEWFATLNKRQLDRIEFVFHLGAKARHMDMVAMMSDPTGLMSWKGRDRCLIAFDNAAAIEKNGPAFTNIVRAWLKYV